MIGKTTVAIDLDHTLMHYDTPLPGAKDALIRLREEGYWIIIHTCNDGVWAANILDKHEMPYDQIWKMLGKPIASCYVDDRGIGFTGDWKQTLAEVFEIEERRRSIPGAV